MLTRRAAAIALVFLVAGVVPVGAHHGWSGYDATKEMTLTGAIKEAGYEHPHGHVRLEVPGKVWLVVLAPPTRMESRGLPAAKLAWFFFSDLCSLRIFRDLARTPHSRRLGRLLGLCWFWWPR